jgi:hypothetical protein
MPNPFELRIPQPRNPKTEVEQERRKAIERLAGHSFETEKGSVYTYDDQGRTSRFKKKTGEQFEPQDITVFIDLNEEECRIFLDAIHTENPDLKKRIYVVEKQEDNKPKIIRKFSEVNDPLKLYLAIFNKDGKMIGSKEATLKPTLNFTTFDTRHFKDGNEWMTERHLGHKVTKIK